MEIKPAVIFDLDGVLVDTVNAHYFGWSIVAKKLGIPFTRQDNEKFRGVHRNKVIRQLIRQADIELEEKEINHLMALKVKCYKEYILENVEKIQIKGIKPLLNALKNNQFPLGLASASKNANLLLNIADLESYFDVTSDGHFPGQLKPDPEQLLFISTQLKRSPSNCIIFEDSIVGLQAAKKAGMIAVAVGKYATQFEVYDFYYESLCSLCPDEFIKTICALHNGHLTPPPPYIT